MKNVSLTIDGRKIKAAEGEKILWVALNNGIYIPNLCALSDALLPSASCRLCFVGIDGYSGPVASCTESVREGMIVNTKAPEALRLARTGFELIMSCHPVDCAHCSRNDSCELQLIAAHLHVKLKTRRFRKIERNLPIDDSSPMFVYDPNKCVLCGRCVWVCRERLGTGILGLVRRGFDRVVGTFGDEPIARSWCPGCEECINVCPTGALSLKNLSVKGMAVKKK